MCTFAATLVWGREWALSQAPSSRTRGSSTRETTMVVCNRVDIYICIYIYIYIYVYTSLSLSLSLSMYIYIYIYYMYLSLSLSLSLSIYIYIYIHMYTYISVCELPRLGVGAKPRSYPLAPICDLYCLSHRCIKVTNEVVNKGRI